MLGVTGCVESPICYGPGHGVDLTYTLSILSNVKRFFSILTTIFTTSCYSFPLDNTEIPKRLSDESKLSDFIIDDSNFIPDFIYDKFVSDARNIDSLKADEFSYAKIMNYPEKNTGKVFKVTGLVIKLWPVKVGTNSMYSTLIFTKDNEPILVHVIKKPEVIYLKEDTVELNGLFVKNVEFQTSSGSIKLPFFMARSIGKFI